MKKALIVFGLTIILSLALVGIASANNGPHGGYTEQTDACAGCHRAHTAVGADYLLVKSSIYELCTTCHGSSGSGSNLDVLDGLYIDGRNANNYNGSGGGSGPLNGGGFLYMGGAAPTNPTDPVTPATMTTSAHNVEGLPSRGYEYGTAGSGETAPAWGGGQAVGIGYQAGGSSSITLECTSCHNPHGSTNYRILNDYSGSVIHGCVATAPVQCSWYGGSTVYGGGDWQELGGANEFQNYQVISQPSDTGKARYSNYTPVIPAGYAGKTAGALIGNYTVGINAFCGTCHQRYYTNTDAPNATANKYVLGAPYSTNSTARTTMFPDYLSSVTDGYDAGDGNGSVAHYRHRVGYSYGVTSLLMPARFAATDGASFTVNANNSITWNYVPTADASSGSTYQTCLTCHYAHGTTAQMTGFATKTIVNGSYVDNPSKVNGVAAGVAPENDSALLFRDGRGVCQNCHRKGGATYQQPTAPNLNNY